MRLLRYVIHPNCHVDESFDSAIDDLVDRNSGEDARFTSSVHAEPLRQSFAPRTQEVAARMTIA
jgi:hypothetical protein